MARIIKPITINNSNLSHSDISQNDYTEWRSGVDYTLFDSYTGHRSGVVQATENSDALYTTYLTYVENISLNGPSSTTNFIDPTRNNTMTLTRNGVPYWIVGGTINKFKMFNFDYKDQSVHNRTTFRVVINDAKGEIDSISLLNIENAQGVRIIVRNEIGETIYLNNYGINSTPVNNWRNFFKSPLNKITNVAFFDLPKTIGGETQVDLYIERDPLLLGTPHPGREIQDPEKQIKIGALIAGPSIDLGYQQYGSSIGIINQKRKNVIRMPYPNIPPLSPQQSALLDQGVDLSDNFYRTSKIDIKLKPEETEKIHNELTNSLDRIILFAFDRDIQSQFERARTDFPLQKQTKVSYNESIVYGYYREFDIVYQNHNNSLCQIELEGLQE